MPFFFFSHMATSLRTRPSSTCAINLWSGTECLIKAAVFSIPLKECSCGIGVIPAIPLRGSEQLHSQATWFGFPNQVFPVKPSGKSLDVKVVKQLLSFLPLPVSPANSSLKSRTVSRCGQALRCAEPAGDPWGEDPKWMAMPIVESNGWFSK